MHTDLKLQGLSSEEVTSSRLRYGQNVIAKKSPNLFKTFAKAATKEPMAILLLVTALIYYFNQNYLLIF